MPEADPNTNTGTLLDNPQGGGVGQSADGKAQSGEWQTSVPEALRPKVAKFKDVGSLAKSYVELESAAGSMVRIPADDAPAEEKAKFYSKIGRPEKAEAYELAGEADDVSLFAPMALEANLTKAQAKHIWDWSMKTAKTRIEAAKAELEKARTEKAQALQAKWGDDYHGKADLASKVAKRFGGDALLALMRRTRLGDEPEVLETFAAIGEVLSEDVLSGGTRTRTPEPAQPKPTDYYPNSPKLK